MSTTDPNRGARTLTRDQRDALYQTAVMAIDARSLDLFLANGGKNAREHAGHVRTWLRLLDDLGYEADDPRDNFAITMPDEQLFPLIRKELDGIHASIPTNHEVWEEETARRVTDEDLDARSACTTALGWAEQARLPSQ